MSRYVRLEQVNDDFARIKNKIMASDPSRYWGDDFDVRFYLVSKLKKLHNKAILDIGGGIGIISSELDKSNFRINLDASIHDLKICKDSLDTTIENVCAVMTELPFKDNVFDCVISASTLQYAKLNDIEKKLTIENNHILQYPAVEKTLTEIFRVLDSNSVLFLVTPNNTYYRSYMLNYHELKLALKNHFSNYVLTFYNSFPRLSKSHRLLNLANLIPKLLSKTIGRDKLLNKFLLKHDNGNNRNSVSFYVEAFKN